ncbi:transcription elongation factor GreA [Candidatus Sororendozoicomonas aggregata]|uniref:transcription elongation factor GreA n=1 Tax=Candidatus Sororendozoicomonas aggregata TaxID=3073239 RepID=UPI002ED0E7A9
MNRYPMTVAGEKALREELKQLKGVERPRISAAIAEARELGDLKENAEYHAAREQQGLVEARINDIEAKLADAQVIDITAIEKTGKVIFGVTVELLNLDTDEKVTYTIVGDDEASIKASKISVNSPIARAMIGKEEGDVVLVNTPSGQVEYEIDLVSHLSMLSEDQQKRREKG